jgi:DNA gyrase subunit A
MSSQPPLEPNITAVELDEEVKRAYLDYAMSVIVGRALPDVRDGLKPVHRRILWGMTELGARPGTSYKKSARVTGHVMGQYHPHGNQAIYDALARLAQDFAMRMPLVDGKGNFGSMDGDRPAAERYTECRLSPLAMQMLDGIDEATVDFIPNYSNETEEPVVMPSRFPNLLVNGSTGIAVGMATNIPPHNLGEVIDAVVRMIDEPDIDVETLMTIVKGPDFPGGGIIMGRAGIRDAFLTGRGSVKVRAKTEFEEAARGGTRIVVTELPYMVSGDKILEKTAMLVATKGIVGIKQRDGLRNESNREGVRLVIELSADAVPQVVLSNLFKHTELQTSFGVNAVALVDGVHPRTLGLHAMLGHYLDHQVSVVTRRTRFRLKKAEDRAHVLEGLLIAVNHIDEVIALIRASDSAEAARGALMERFGLSEIQATAILDMQLRRLAALERQKLQDEYDDLQATIADLKALLADPKKLLALIKSELLDIRAKFANPRRTMIESDAGEIDLEDLIADEDVVITMSRTGYVKRVKSNVYKTQRRGGRGVKGAATKQDDIVEHLLTTSNHAWLLFFSNRGKVYRIKAHEVPEKDRTARGISIRQLLPVASDESIAAIIDTRDYETQRFLTIATHAGIIKKTEFSAYDSTRRDGIIALRLRDDDEVVAVRASTGTQDVIMVSHRGQAICFTEDEVRPMGRTAGGVIGMKFRSDDSLQAFDVVRPGSDLLLVTDQGFGKRVALDKFPRKHRAGLGVKAMNMTSRKGFIAGAEVVDKEDEVFLINSGGVVIRTRVKEIRSMNRDAGGVKVMSLEAEQQLVAMAVVAERDDDETDAG